MMQPQTQQMSSQILSQESGGLPKTIEVQAAAMRGDPRKVKAQAKINDELITLMAANSAISAIKREENYLASLLEGDRGGTLKDRKPKELENAIIASNMQKLQPKIDQAMGIAAQNKRKSDKNIQQVAMGRNQSTGIMPRPVKTKMAQGGIARFQGLSGSQVNAITDDLLKKMGLTRSQYEALSDDEKRKRQLMIDAPTPNAEEKEAQEKGEIQRTKESKKLLDDYGEEQERLAREEYQQSVIEGRPLGAVLDSSDKVTKLEKPPTYADRQRAGLTAALNLPKNVAQNISEGFTQRQKEAREGYDRQKEARFRKNLTDAGVSQEAIEEAVINKFSAGIPAAGVDTNTVATTTASAPTNTVRPNFSTIAPTGLSPYIARDPMVTQEDTTGAGAGPATDPTIDPTTGPATNTGIPNAGVAKIDDSNIKQMIKQLGTGDYTVPQNLITQSMPQGLMTQLEGDAAKNPMSAFKLSDARLKEMGISREDYDKLGFMEQQELFFDRKGQKEKREANLTKLKTLGDEQATPEKQQARKARAFFAVYSPVQRALQQQERKEESSKYQRTLRTIGLDDENMKRDFEIANSVSQTTGKVYGEIAADRRTAMAALSNIGIENAKAAEQRLESKRNDDRSKLGAQIDMFTVEANRAMTEAKVLAQQETSRAINQTNRIQAIGALITGLNSLRAELRETVKESMSPDTLAAIEKAERDPNSLNDNDKALIADFQLELEAANPDAYFELQNAFLKALGIDLGTYFSPLEKNKNTSTQAITQNFNPNAPSS
jgi:hypothetical protein